MNNKSDSSLEHYRVIRVQFTICGWIEDTPKTHEEGEPQVGNETAADLFMVGEWDEELQNYRVSPLDEVFESWAEAMSKTIELENKYEQKK